MSLLPLPVLLSPLCTVLVATALSLTRWQRHLQLLHSSTHGIYSDSLRRKALSTQELNSQCLLLGSTVDSPARFTANFLCHIGPRLWADMTTMLFWAAQHHKQDHSSSWCDPCFPERHSLGSSLDSDVGSQCLQRPAPDPVKLAKSPSEEASSFNPKC